MHTDLPSFHEEGIYGNQARASNLQALADVSRSRYVATTAQPMHRLQIWPIVHS